MKRFFKSFCSFGLVLLLILSLSITSFADINDLMIGTGSNALMTMELDDSDYNIVPFSSIVSINNTVHYDSLRLYVRLVDEESGMNQFQLVRIDDDGSYQYYIPSGYQASVIGFEFLKGAVPVPGNYRFQVDLSSDISVTYSGATMRLYRYIDNVQTESEAININSYLSQSYGDAYLDFVLGLGNVSAIQLNYYLSSYLPSGSVVAGVVKVNFAESSLEPDVSSFGSDNLTQEYQNNVSSSLSDLSSSVGEMTEEISGVTQAIQNLQGAMEPHYNNVLTQLHHITEQLHAFYDQVYNNIHLPELDMLTQIRNAIENIDLQIEVDISEVKTAINNMSTAVQNKLQSTTDQITGGYDNSGMSSDKTELDGVLGQYEQAEEELFDDAQGHINDFEFNTPLDHFTGPLADVSYFLNGMFEAMGPMNVVISFSLTLTIAMVMIGWYRFKGGR